MGSLLLLLATCEYSFISKKKKKSQLRLVKWLREQRCLCQYTGGRTELTLQIDTQIKH